MFYTDNDFLTEESPKTCTSISICIRLLKPHSSDVLFVGNTKLVWFEVCSNPLNMVVDLKATIQTVKEFNSEITVGIDNTFLSPWIVVTYFFYVKILKIPFEKSSNWHLFIDVDRTWVPEHQKKFHTDLKTFLKVPLSEPKLFQGLIPDECFTTPLIWLRNWCDYPFAILAKVQSANIAVHYTVFNFSRKFSYSFVTKPQFPQISQKSSNYPWFPEILEFSVILGFFGIPWISPDSPNFSGFFQISLRFPDISENIFYDRFRDLLISLYFRARRAEFRRCMTVIPYSRPEMDNFLRKMTYDRNSPEAADSGRKYTYERNSGFVSRFQCCMTVIPFCYGCDSVW